MDDLLLLYPNRKSYPHQIGKVKDILDLFSEEVRFLREQVAALKQTQFGQKSEKTKQQAESEEEQKIRKQRNRNKDNYQHKGRNPFPEHLPVDVIEYDLKPEEKQCPCCKAFLAKIGKTVTKQLDLVPQTIIVREHTRLKYACRT